MDRIYRINIIRFDSNTAGTERFPGKNGVGKIWIAGRKSLTIGATGV
jgi:hypothetical protein